MITNFKIKNFQSHPASELEFHEGVNAIIGSSDSGKTSIIRALVWLLSNRPTGEAFKSWWAGKKDRTSVSLDTSEGHAIVHERVKGKSSYVVNGEELKAHGANVPEHVSDIMRMGPYNVQTQYNRHFLLQMSAGEVAREFSSIVNLDEIGDILQRMNSLAWKNARKVEVLEQRHEELREDLEDFSFVPNLEKDLGRLEQLSNKTQQKRALQADLSRVVEKVQMCSAGMEKLKPLASLAPNCEELLSLCSEIEAKNTRLMQLGSLMVKIMRMEEDMAGLELLAGLEDECRGLLTQLDRIEELDDRAEVLDSLMDKIESKEEAARAEGDRLEGLKMDFADLIQRLGQCPFCFGEIGEESIGHIMEHV